MTEFMYRTRISQYPTGALAPRVAGHPGDCEVTWWHNPEWTPPDWMSNKPFYWPQDGKLYRCQSTAERLARLLESYGAKVVVERSCRIVWPDDPSVPQQL